MPSPKLVNGLPYKTRIYINNQVLLPAKLVRMLGIEWARYADITIRHNDRVITLRRVALLRTRHTASRQFAIPREVRERYGIRPLDDVEVLNITPIRIKEVDTKQLVLDE
ncbi:MAG: AbrB/MazE/SpoVT family DNA-binding domain-containing protein [Vulcanisaeta sp.]|jgi:bifunctional DNA-binding transcriptional regulator/antitoxin component of YhaV-PrlF toxin-antitoxin module|uniref:AbrB/MazE/SpoVT family DNA-binding domain-containing protein n=1 Tax=Vulcanisaeta sp. TaxID=2020871 RepID=UPI003D10CC79